MNQITGTHRKTQRTKHYVQTKSTYNNNNKNNNNDTNRRFEPIQSVGFNFVFIPRMNHTHTQIHLRFVSKFGTHSLEIILYISALIAARCQCYCIYTTNTEMFRLKILWYKLEMKRIRRFQTFQEGLKHSKRTEKFHTVFCLPISI